MTDQRFTIVDSVERETAEYLEGTDAALAYGDDRVFVLEQREE